jgi:hypothetical protein
MITTTILGLAFLTSTTNVDNQPAWLAEASKKYEACIYSAIDRQYRTRRFSEKTALTECAVVRDDQVRQAESAAIRASAPKEQKSLIGAEFSRLDALAWTIVGHLRERRRNTGDVR